MKKERTLGKRLVGIETNLHFTLTGDVIQHFPLSLFDKTGCTILVIIKLLFFFNELLIEVEKPLFCGRLHKS